MRQTRRATAVSKAARSSRSPRPPEIERRGGEEGLAGLAADDDPAMGFVGIAGLRQAADALERYQVRCARDAGWTWSEVGEALGISAQAAHKRHAGDVES